MKGKVGESGRTCCHFMSVSMLSSLLIFIRIRYLPAHYLFLIGVRSLFSSIIVFLWREWASKKMVEKNVLFHFFFFPRIANRAPMCIDLRTERKHAWVCCPLCTFLLCVTFLRALVRESAYLPLFSQSPAAFYLAQVCHIHSISK